MSSEDSVGQGGPFEAIGCTDAVAIATGGSSVVYRARQVAFDRLVALKVLNIPLLDDRSRRRFQRELSLAGRMTGHPNVTTVFASGILADGRGYVEMEYCPGGSLADRLTRSGPLPVAEVLSIGIKLAGVLELAGRQGIVHRDVKPANVLVTRFGEPALSDFGIAVVGGEVTGTTQALTPVHAPPEVFESRDVGPAADQWSLASTLFTLLAGRPPFAGDGAADEGIMPGMLRVLNQPVPPIARGDVPGGLQAALERGLAKKVEDRWASPSEFARALQDLQRRAGWPVTPLPVDEVVEASRTWAGAPGSDVSPSSTGPKPVSAGRVSAPADGPVGPAPVAGIPAAFGAPPGLAGGVGGAVGPWIPGPSGRANGDGSGATQHWRRGEGAPPGTPRADAPASPFGGPAPARTPGLQAWKWGGPSGTGFESAGPVTVGAGTAGAGTPSLSGPTSPDATQHWRRHQSAESAAAHDVNAPGRSRAFWIVAAAAAAALVAAVVVLLLVFA